MCLGKLKIHLKEGDFIPQIGVVLCCLKGVSTDRGFKVYHSRRHWQNKLRRSSIAKINNSVFASLLVLVSTSLLGKSLVAMFALERTFPSVDALVGHHVCALYKALAAEPERQLVAIVKI